MTIFQLSSAIVTATPGSAVDSQIEHTWPWASGYLIVLALAAAVICYLAYRREVSQGRWMLIPWSARCLVLVLIVIMLFGWLRRSFKTELPDIVLAFDASISMSTVDQFAESGVRQIVQRLGTASKEACRLDIGRNFWLQQDAQRLTALAERFQLRTQLWGNSVYEFDGEPLEIRAKLQEQTATIPQSRLGSCLLSAVEQQRGRTTAAIVLMTDGVTTEGPTLSEAAQAARQRRIPLYLVGLGEERHPSDIGISEVVGDSFAFVGDLLTFDTVVTHYGFAGKTIAVRLMETASGKPLSEESVLLGADGEAASIRLSHRPTSTGEFDYRIEIGVPENDQIRENNQTLRHVSVREAKIRVLYVQGYANPEFHFLKRLLGTTLQQGDGQPESSSSIQKAFDFHVILQDADAEYVEQDEAALRTFPVKREDLFAYDVIILGDVDPGILGRSALQNVRDFVLEHGGGLVILAGPRFTPLDLEKSPLEDLLPVSLSSTRVPSLEAKIETGFQVRPSIMGMSMSHLHIADKPSESISLWQTLPELYWLAESDQVRPGARVLLEHPTKTSGNGEPLPVVSLLFAGAGKVIYQATDESYRWSRGVKGDAPFNAYWLQTLRFLCRSRLFSGNQRIDIVTDREEYQLDDRVHLRVRFLDERLAPASDQGVSVVVEGGGVEPRNINIASSPMDRTVFQRELAGLAVGEYRVWLASPNVEGGLPSTRFSVRSANRETEMLRMNAEEMREAARITGGKFYSLAELHKLPRELPSGSRIRLEPLPPEPLWNSPWLAGLVVGLLILEWIMRRRYGLV